MNSDDAKRRRELAELTLRMAEAAAALGPEGVQAVEREAITRNPAWRSLEPKLPPIVVSPDPVGITVNLPAPTVRLEYPGTKARTVIDRADEISPPNSALISLNSTVRPRRRTRRSARAVSAWKDAGVSVQSAIDAFSRGEELRQLERTLVDVYVLPELEFIRSVLNLEMVAVEEVLAMRRELETTCDRLARIRDALLNAGMQIAYSALGSAIVQVTAAINYLPR